MTEYEIVLGEPKSPYKTKNIVALIAIFAVLAIVCIVSDNKNREHLYLNRKLTSATVHSVFQYDKYFYTYLRISYIANGNLVVTKYNFKDWSYQNAKLLVGKSFLLFYDSTEVYRMKLLLGKQDFEKFGLVQPDSLRWVDEY